MQSYRDEILRIAGDRYGTEPEYPWAIYPRYAVLRHGGSGKWYALIGDVPRSKLGLDGDERVDVLNVRCGPLMAGSLRMKPGFLPAYHMNKANWISILLDGTVSPDQIVPLLEMSYDFAGTVKKKPRTLRIRHTTEADIPAVMDIYAKARAFMAEHGNPNQWGRTGWPPETLIRADIQARNSYVCESGDHIAAVFYYHFGDKAEPTYAEITDGQWQDDSPYGVVHRIASDGTVKGAGSHCIQWAFEQCGHLRMDTHGDNKVMQSLLKKLGFRYCGIVHVLEDNDPRLAYEKTNGAE